MKILFINRFFFPDESATSQILTELAEDLVRLGNSVTIITGRVDYLGSGSLLPARGMHKGIEIRRVRSSNFNRGQSLGRLADYLSFYVTAGWAALRCKKHDCLVVLSDPPLLSVLAVIVGVLKRCKTVCWLQDIFPEIAIRAGVLSEGHLARVLRWIASWSLQHTDRTVVIGRCMERHLLSHGMPASKVLRIANWADGSYVQPVNRQENWFAKEQEFGDRFVMMYSGNLGVVHEIETFCAMIRQVRNVDRVCFCFIGQGHHKEGLLEAARSEGWNHVLFLPYQGREAMRFALPAGDVHLVSLRSDMVGLSVPSKIYGIMAAGRPIVFVGPTESEAAEVIREADCGYVIEPGRGNEATEALLTYYRDRSLVERHGRAARAYLDRHCDRQLVTGRFWSILREVAAS
jgi:glycosyltransferase involved in cell wall biosynthesis